MRKHYPESLGGLISSAGSSPPHGSLPNDWPAWLLTRYPRRSASFYPQLLENYLHKSTLGLAIDFPTLNVLGFACYTLSTASFLYSPTIKAQYAQRHPEAPEPTVRFNDFLFAAHGAVMCIIGYTQFFPRIWGFAVGQNQRASRAVLAIWWGCVMSIVTVVLIVLSRSGQGDSEDTSAWAWIDVVSCSDARCLSIHTHTHTYTSMYSFLPGLHPRLR